jgi:site-specific DNA recombinase
MQTSPSYENVTLIPRMERLHDSRIKVAVYCRVSNKSINLEDSLENQITHYKEELTKNPRYELVNIYYDFGISGFKEKRPGFQKMMEDSRQGKFELVITKSITRFARNTATVLNATRELKSHGIGVYFELQKINTLGEGGELLMTLYAAFGQAESQAGCVSTRMAIQRKLEKGESLSQVQRIFGYTKNEKGEIIPDANAKWVMEIFEMAADGFTVAEITNYLNREGVKTQTGKQFYRETVRRILKNEEYKGDFVQMKHYVDEHRKQHPNHGEKQMYYFHENHLPIVTNELWENAQKVFMQKKKDAPEERKALTDENYPYRHQLYCGHCGNRLMRVYVGGKYQWTCSGKRKYSHKFCPGVSIPDEVVKSWGSFSEKRYISATYDRGRLTGYSWQAENEWTKDHTKKQYQSQVPELTKENYPYMDRIYCKYCGSRLRRIINRNGTITWICDNFSRNGKQACKGIRVPDEKLQGLRNLAKDVYIGKEIINGKECYGYSSKPDNG